jgi:protein-S-isoprenylcysteine O-methyltransferase Ste14
VRILRAASTFLSVLLIYQGICVLGWGLDDFAGYYALGPRLAYALVVAAFGVAGAVQAYGSIAGIRGARGVKGKRVERQTVVSVAMVLGMYASFAFLPYADRREIATISLALPLRWVGVLLACVGYVLVLWSGIALGSMYSKEVTIQEGHRLVTTGLCGVLRHPRYLGVLCLSVGLTLLYRSWIGVAMTLVLVIVLLRRIGDEEQMLRLEFAEVWDRYVRRTWRLIPGAY